jgi:hypothetical protein
MKLYIQTENGQTVNHPALESNLIAAFGGVPDHWKPFVRVERPTFGVYEILESEQPAYQMVDGVWTDVWTVRPMTDEEKTAKHQALVQSVLAMWELNPNAFNFTAWVLEEDIDAGTAKMVPPIPRPVEEGKIFRWSGADNNWKEAPARPEGEGQYVFDFAQWIWVIA